MFSRIIPVCGSITLKSHSCNYFGAKKKIWAVEISLTKCLLSFRVLRAPCPLGITLLLGAKAVTEFIIVSGRMVGLILVMQCVPRCAGSSGSWRCKGSPCFLHAVTIPSVCLSSWELFPRFLSQTYHLECVFESSRTIIRLNCRGDWV